MTDPELQKAYDRLMTKNKWDSSDTALYKECKIYVRQQTGWKITDCTSCIRKVMPIFAKYLRELK